jgi:hypothetical protein
MFAYLQTIYELFFCMLGFKVPPMLVYVFLRIVYMHVCG